MNPRERKQVLRFDIGGLMCAVPLANVREVQRAVELTPLPGAPGVIEGAIDMRGEIIPVADLGSRLGLPQRPVRAAQWLVLVWTGTRVVALRADAVHWLVAISEEDVRTAAEITRGTIAVSGVVRTPDGLVLLQDPEALLRQAEAESLEDALAAAARR